MKKELQSKDFRVGNYYHFIEIDRIVIERIEIIDSNMVDCNPMNLIKPIKLTDKWLESFGFHNLNLKTRERWSNYKIEIRKGIKRNGYPFYLSNYNYMANKGMLYVHELQNLHFALTGEELELKRGLSLNN